MSRRAQAAPPHSDNGNLSDPTQPASALDLRWTCNPMLLVGVEMVRCAANGIRRPANHRVPLVFPKSEHRHWEDMLRAHRLDELDDIPYGPLVCLPASQHSEQLRQLAVQSSPLQQSKEARREISCPPRGTQQLLAIWILPRNWRLLNQSEQLSPKGAVGS
mmetsp:Transcript_961/g.2606  ORF Transcript_961/g.2606 Transcript_961/m.2606 type:complete len:161 (+) Transcript_961:18-500(+)